MLVSLTATSDIGCKTTDELYIQVEKARLIQFPNAFSPNNDGLNDLFLAVAKSPNVSSIKRLVIYDRWGNPVYGRSNFHVIDSEKAWDGTKNGKALPPGTYPYLAEVLFLDNIVLTYRGSITLIK